ncbi:MAG: hypothetical protein IKN54_03795, partial [Lachnospiraceae bacterium]|nr:hypothetical protein [Lachnospiraceae bacterium]
MTFLKLEDKTILKFDLNNNYYEILFPDLLPLSLRDNLVDTTNVSDINVWFNNKNLIAQFFNNRTLSVRRENAKYIMNQLGIRQDNDFETKLKAMILCKGLSVTDNYWITQNENEKWKDVNLSENPLHETLQQIALFGKSLTITGEVRSPELTGQGAYAKAWYRENGELYLFKASSKGGDESKREVLASNILDCFNVPHVKYELAEKDGMVLCKCKNMNYKHSSIVDSVEFDIWTTRKGLNFYEEVKKIDSELFYKTIVVDYLISNSDRHSGNWGFFMDNRTGKIVCMHPLFDHNNAFDPNFMNDPSGGICQLIPGKNQKEAALYAIKHCDFFCIRPITESMFYDKKMYESFMSRACEL